MITVLCMNPSIDQQVTVEELRVGKTNRIEVGLADAGGKGLNCAMSLKDLKADARLFLALPRDDRGIVLNCLRQEGLEAEVFSCPGKVRVNYKVFSRSSGQMTELNEPGPALPEDVLDQIKTALIDAASRGDALMLTGSLPPGVPSGFYADIVRVARAYHCPCAVDADDDVLKAAVEEGPFLIKPNREELERLIGESARSLQALGMIGRWLCDKKGIRYCCVSLGSEGAILANKDHAIHCSAAPIKIRRQHAGGDAMLSALTLQLTQGSSLADALKTACALAGCTLEMDRSQEEFRRVYNALSVSSIS